jgi:hypothetical protein
MMNHEVRLMNFLIDPRIKKKFSSACRSKQSNMTAELNRMIRVFVSNQSEPTIFERPLRWIIGEREKKS